MSTRINTSTIGRGNRFQTRYRITIAFVSRALALILARFGHRGGHCGNSAPRPVLPVGTDRARHLRCRRRWSRPAYGVRFVRFGRWAWLSLLLVGLLPLFLVPGFQDGVVVVLGENFIDPGDR